MIRIIGLLGAALLAFALSACGKPFRAPPANFEMWQKAGASNLEIQKAVMECGYKTPGYGFEEKVIDRNSYALQQLCMQKNGFIYDRREKTFCRHYPSLDACKPENVGAIPDRDINKRLNSPFCKQRVHANYPECK